jgi:leucyl aminopeptidase
MSFFYKGSMYHIGIIGYNEKVKKESYESFKNNVGRTISYAQRHKASAILIYIGEELYSCGCIYSLAKILQTTVLLKLYHFNAYISDSKKHAHQAIDIFWCLSDNKKKEPCQKGIDEGMIIGNAINFSRNLSDIPAKEMYPAAFIDTVSEEIRKRNITCEKIVFNAEELKKLGMGGIVGVGQGSCHEPQLLLLKYTGRAQEREQKTIALVGKGVTFDTGGISIKPSDGMEDMKADMSGAAAVVSSFIGLAQLGSPHTIYAVTPLAENMVDGNSIRPGDILRFYNGKTAEIKNTDAEGRLILADALSYVSEKYKPDIIIDLATLTGACRIALGPVYAGLMSEDTKLRDSIERAGIKSGDQCWPLPLEKAYEPNMYSDVADMCNIGTKGYKAGATMGGMFLREFVPQGISWAHIDIAPVATDCPIKKYIHSFGATGFGVNLLIELFQNKDYIK